MDRPILSVDQLSRLAEELGPDQAPMMWTAAVLGLRCAECARLSVASIDALRATLSVTKQLGRDHRLVSPKSAAGKRTMAVPAWLPEALSAVLARRGVTGAEPSTLVFVNGSGRPWSYPPWRQQVWIPACERADLEGLRFHDLRSLATTAMVAAGVDIKTAQTRLGHANPGTTLGVYARASQDADRKASEKLAEVFVEVFRPRDGRGMIRSEPMSQA